MALSAIVLVLATQVAFADEIKEIIVEENTKTDSETVRTISRIDTGDDWSPEMSDLVKNRLEASGLFKDVSVFWDEHPEGGIRVHITVHDKHSWIIAPAFYNQPTNTGGGVGFGENNLFGYNQKLLIYGQVATGDTFFIGAWVIPNLGGTRFYTQLDTFLKSSRVIEYAAPTSYLDNPVEVRQSRLHYFNAGIKLGLELFRGFKVDTRLRGALVSYQDVQLLPTADVANSGIDCTLIDCNDPDMLPPPGDDGTDVSIETTASLDRRAYYYGVYSGYKYGVSFETAVPSLGSDFRYNLTGINFFHGTRVFERHNFVVKGSLGYGQRLPFQQEYAVGGTSMRGYVNNQFRGNLKFLSNVEYSFPLFTVMGLGIRGLLFFDTSYITFTKTGDNLDKRNYLPNAKAADLADADQAFAPFKNAIGLGTRFTLKQIVLPLLGLDVGYGLESRDLQIYLAIGLTD